MIPGTAPGVPAQANGRPAGFIGYVWRDPARVSPDRLAALAAHDDYIASLHEEPDETRSEAWQAENPTARQLVFNGLRAENLTIADAAQRMCLGDGTARRYERIRNRIEQQKEAAAQ
jgi:hypothetical protein